MKSILLVDSEDASATLLEGALRKFGFSVALVASSNEAHTTVKNTHVDLILLDFDLSPRPGSDKATNANAIGQESRSGTGLIRELRAARVTCPILVYTSLSGELYETASLDAGADDYILKNAPMSLLLSRLHAHLRRMERDLGTASRQERRVAIGRYTLDREARVLLADEKPVVLATREMVLMEKLASNPGRIFSPTEILDVVWGQHLRRSNAALAGVLRRLRLKMLTNGLPDPVENIRGKGFRLLPALTLDR